ncbi:hypothetical protein [Paenarthrobacter sp. YJN-5]|uniref:hypothetical protein n=1 Tax=Paenarthrobacter sp. YJN-5 TaxID=2735316 RepID=UPI0018782408|nr:hypothetical protein [Paenarthrobacter sp. YJN-5]QOT16749.1 hypothetical protein HMI59_09145 [Paenarthrobacter sp. YJN-5]
MTDASAAIKDAAEEAANSVISAHGIAVEDEESCFEALCWALGTGVPYEKGLLQFAQAIVDGFDLKGLVDTKIELLGDYKLDYPQDYEPEDVSCMRAELERLRSLQQQLTRPAG